MTSFDWQDPFGLDTQISEDERLIREAAHAFADEVRTGRYPDDAHSFE